MTYSAIPKWTITDTNGEPVVNGTVEFFEAGTTTPKDVYSDAGRTITAGDTLTTDALGQVGPVYLDTAAATKAVCKDADSVTLWTVDNLTAPTGTSASVFSLTRSVSPLDFGAIGDGASDESTEVQQAIDAGTGFVDLAGKTYRCDSGITLNNGTRIINGTLDFSNMASGSSCISATGSIASGVFASSSIAGGDRTITLTSTATFTAGRWIKVSSNEEWSSSLKDGELTRIESLASGTVLSLESRLVDAYTTANSAKAEQLTMLKDISIEDVRIIGTTLTSADVLHFTYCENVSIRNVRISTFLTNGARFTTCANCHIYCLDARDSEDGNAILFGGTSHQCSVDGLMTSLVDTGLSIGGSDDGVCRYIHASKCSITSQTDSVSSFAGVFFQNQSQNCTIENSSIRCGEGQFAYGVYDRGIGNVVSSCTITGASDTCILCAPEITKARSYEGLTSYTSYEYRSNRMTAIDYGITFDRVSGTVAVGGVVADNHIEYVGESAFLFNSDAGLSDIEITNNRIGRAKRVVEFSETGTYADILVDGNTAKTCQQFGLIDINDDSTDIEISRNVVKSLTGTINIAIDVDVATTKTLAGLRIVGNRFVCVDSTFRNAVKVVSNDIGAITDFAIDDNVCKVTDQDDGYYAVEVYDAKQGTINGNKLHGASLIAGVLYKGSSSTGTGPIGEVSVDGNYIRLTGTQPTGTPEDCGIFFEVAGSASMADVSAKNNDIEGPDTAADNDALIYAKAATGLTIQNILVACNRVNGQTTSSGIEFESVDADGIQYGVISGNYAVAYEDAVKLTNCKHIVVSGNGLRTTSVSGDDAVFVSGGDSITVSGNTLISDKTSTPSQCATVNSSEAVLFSGNVMSGGYYMLVTDSVSSNNLIAAIGNVRINRGSVTMLSGTFFGESTTTPGDFDNAQKTV